MITIDDIILGRTEDYHVEYQNSLVKRENAPPNEPNKEYWEFEFLVDNCDTIYKLSVLVSNEGVIEVCDISKNDYNFWANLFDWETESTPDDFNEAVMSFVKELIESIREGEDDEEGTCNEEVDSFESTEESRKDSQT